MNKIIRNEIESIVDTLRRLVEFYAASNQAEIESLFEALKGVLKENKMTLDNTPEQFLDSERVASQIEAQEEMMELMGEMETMLPSLQDDAEDFVECLDELVEQSLY